MLGNFQGFINALEASGYKINSIGGYNNRLTRGSGTPSEHAFGNAIDINPGTNPSVRGQLITNMPDNVSQLAADNGLIWGGNWNSLKDAMHFEYNDKTGIPMASSVDKLPNAIPNQNPNIIVSPETMNQMQNLGQEQMKQMENYADQSHSPPADTRDVKDQSPSKEAEVGRTT